jgi:hypothetical protein
MSAGLNIMGRSCPLSRQGWLRRCHRLLSSRYRSPPEMISPLVPLTAWYRPTGNRSRSPIRPLSKSLAIFVIIRHRSTNASHYRLSTLSTPSPLLSPSVRTTYIIASIRTFDLALAKSPPAVQTLIMHQPHTVHQKSL